jgi:hypothetical protein
VRRALLFVGLVAGLSAQVAKIQVVSGSGQGAVVNTEFGQPVVVQVTNASGTPLSNVSVTFTLQGAQANALINFGLTTVTVKTDGNGLASTGVLAANAYIGSYTGKATAGGMTANFSFLIPACSRPQSCPAASYSRPTWAIRRRRRRPLKSPARPTDTPLPWTRPGSRSR